jgi:hypothetical protein
MARFILLFLLFSTAVMFLFSFVLGFLRRMFGFGPKTPRRPTSPGPNVTEITTTADGIEVIRTRRSQSQN